MEGSCLRHEHATRMLIGLARCASKTQLSDKEGDQRAYNSAKTQSESRCMPSKSVAKHISMKYFQRRSTILQEANLPCMPTSTQTAESAEGFCVAHARWIILTLAKIHSAQESEHKHAPWIGGGRPHTARGSDWSVGGGLYLELTIRASCS
jgi:hypothetical protein